MASIRFAVLGYSADTPGTDSHSSTSHLMNAERCDQDEMFDLLRSEACGSIRSDSAPGGELVQRAPLKNSLLAWLFPTMLVLL